MTLDVRAAAYSRPGRGIEDVERRPGADHLVQLEVEDVDDTPVAQRRVGRNEAVRLREVGDLALEIDAPQPRHELVRIGVV